MTFTPGQIAALRKLRELWPDRPFVLVGASALGCFLDFRWRATNDIDISVSSNSTSCPPDSIGCRDGRLIRGPSIGGSRRKTSRSTSCPPVRSCAALAPFVGRAVATK